MGERLAGQKNLHRYWIKASSAFWIRSPRGIVSREATAPLFFWTRKVMMQEAMVRAKKGSFSGNKRRIGVLGWCRVGAAADWKAGLESRNNCARPNGQWSRRRRTKGRVTSMGLLMRPRAKRARARRYKSGEWRMIG